jgi:hypothetical protein
MEVKFEDEESMHPGGRLDFTGQQILHLTLESQTQIQHRVFDK